MAVTGPSLPTVRVKLTVSPAVNGPTDVSVLTMDTSAEVPVASPSSSVLLAGVGSGSSGVAVAEFSKAPAPLIVAVTVMLTVTPELMLAMTQGKLAQAPDTFVMVRFVGVSVTSTPVAVDGPLLVTSMLNVTDCPAEYGPAVVRVLTTSTSADVPAVSPSSSVLSVGSGSGSSPSAVALLPNAPFETMVAVTVTLTVAPMAMLGIVHGSAAQPPPATFVIVRFVGTSVT